MRRWVAVLAVVALAATGCVGEQPVRVEATFDDVGDLVVGASVKAGDITVGTVDAIALTDDHRAHVTMEVGPDSGLPAEVEAVLTRSAVLGERIIELRPLSRGGELSSGEVARARELADVEQLVRTGNELLVGISADRLASALEAGAIAIGGRASTIGSLVDRLRVFVGTYEDGTADVLRLLDATDAVVGGLAAEAETNAAAVSALADASVVLAEEDDRLLDALSDLRRLADVAAPLLSEHRDEIDVGVHRLRLVLEQILRIDGALQGVLTWLPRHNIHVPNGVLFEMAQVWNDFSVCGVHSEEENPSNSCDPPNPGESNDPPPGYAPDSCDDRHEGCPYPDDAEPYRPGDDGGRR